ncbi:uncharacterized protein PAC_14806 [Phialocephala subalpina]|uniref:Uncharacterized protein n=1 Tax=Phialocephala subalpina TaxID=576137 RepID=A0A1L7XIX9_9HELO|nr:uncharacterized protein PAC_14806 [Phialocephala subalpina]
MSLNTINVFEILQSLNYTANCAIAIPWMESQARKGLNRSLPTNDSLNTLFLRSTLPPDLPATKDMELIDLYNYLDRASPHVWAESAIKSIQTECIAPALDKALHFEDLDLTQNCTATAAYYANSICAVSGPKHPTSGSGLGWIVNSLGEFKWITALSPPSQNITSTPGLSMLRNALPSMFKDLSDDELKLWAGYSVPDTRVFNNGSQIAAACRKCMPELCLAAAFTGNPDIAGPGAIVSYLMGAFLVILSVICWGLGKVADFSHIPSMLPWYMAAKNTRGVLAGSAMGLSFSLSVALLFMEFTNLADDIGSYYQLNIAMNATFITLNSLLVFVSINYRLLEIFGTEFERLAIAACCVTDGLFVLATFALVFTIKDKGFEFGDTPCFEDRLGTKVFNNPLFYSLTFFVPAILARIVVFVTIVLKRIDSGTLLPRRLLPYAKSSSTQKLDGFISSLEENYQSWYSTLTHIHLFIAFLCIFSLCFEVAYMFRLRDAMKTIGGNAWSEGPMGFGQVLALLVWMPVIMVFVFSLGNTHPLD